MKSSLELIFHTIRQVLAGKQLIDNSNKYRFMCLSAAFIHLIFCISMGAIGASILCYYNIFSHKVLFEERKSRSLGMEGLRLFYGGPVVLDSEDKYNLIKPFFEEIAPEVRRYQELYAPIDLFLMDAVLSCQDYQDFLQKYGRNIMFAFIRSRKN